MDADGRRPGETPGAPGPRSRHRYAGDDRHYAAYLLQLRDDLDRIETTWVDWFPGVVAGLALVFVVCLFVFLGAPPIPSLFVGGLLGVPAGRSARAAWLIRRERRAILSRIERIEGRSRGIDRMATILIVLGLHGCDGSIATPMASPETAAVHSALLTRIDADEPALLLVRSSTPGGRGPARPWSDERIGFLRSSGMDVDRDLARRLAEAVGGPAVPVRLPAGLEGIGPRDGVEITEDPTGFFFQTLDGRRAEVVQLYPVAFSTDGARALTLVEFTCGPRECGAVVVALLRRSGAAWVVESRVVISES